jgi:hypothetical protein
MSRRAHMSQAAQDRRIERDQTTLEDVRTVAEKIAFSFEVAVAELPKLENYPATQAKVQRRVTELGNQLMLLSEYSDEYAACFHIEEPPHSLKIHNPSESIREELDDLDGWLGIEAKVDSAYMQADLGTRHIVSGGEVLELDAPQPEADDEEDLPF